MHVAALFFESAAARRTRCHRRPWPPAPQMGVAPCQIGMRMDRMRLTMTCPVACADSPVTQQMPADFSSAQCWHRAWARQPTQGPLNSSPRVHHLQSCHARAPAMSLGTRRVHSARGGRARPHPWSSPARPADRRPGRPAQSCAACLSSSRPPPHPAQGWARERARSPPGGPACSPGERWRPQLPPDARPHVGPRRQGTRISPARGPHERFVRATRLLRLRGLRWRFPQAPPAPCAGRSERSKKSCPTVRWRCAHARGRARARAPPCGCAPPSWPSSSRGGTPPPPTPAASSLHRTGGRIASRTVPQPPQQSPPVPQGFESPLAAWTAPPSPARRGPLAPRRREARARGRAWPSWPRWA
mmetsp:Transcript_19939/g.53700  ORF Transcript_19939/g.53700 Transcript_19939/m.53700 type:complete len:359 (+) Transcript_19939:725-1801(+)